MTGNCLFVLSSAAPDAVREGIDFFILQVFGQSAVCIIPGTGRIGGAGIAGTAAAADEIII